MATKEQGNGTTAENRVAAALETGEQVETKADIDPRRDPVAWARANCRTADTKRVLKLKGSVSVLTVTLTGTFEPDMASIKDQVASQDADKGIPAVAPPFDAGKRIAGKDAHKLTPDAVLSLIKALSD